MSNYYRPGGFGGFSFFPPVIKNLLIINGVIFAMQVFGGAVTISEGITFGDIITKYFALNPLESGLMQSRAGGAFELVFYPWQLITYQFLHADFGHIFFNLFTLWMFGMEIENMWGSKKFLTFYLLCGIAGGLLQLLVAPLLTDRLGPVIGASGAIFGVMIAFAAMFPNRYIFIYFLFPIKAKYLIGILIAMQFFIFSSGGSSNIAYLAHLGGAIAGFIYILFDRASNTELRSMFRKRSEHTSRPFNPFGGMSEKFSRRDKRQDVEDATFYEVNENEEKITQQQIDAILDKISQSGYQNLTEKEKKILFEASKKMK